MRILVAEDDERTADYLVKGLTESGHIVDRVVDGPTALVMALEGIYEALVLDRKLPGLDGVALVCAPGAMTISRNPIRSGSSWLGWRRLAAVPIAPGGTRSCRSAISNSTRSAAPSRGTVGSSICNAANSSCLSSCCAMWGKW